MWYLGRIRIGSYGRCLVVGLFSIGGWFMAIWRLGRILCIWLSFPTMIREILQNWRTRRYWNCLLYHCWPVWFPNPYKTIYTTTATSVMNGLHFNCPQTKKNQKNCHKYFPKLPFSYICKNHNKNTSKDSIFQNSDCQK